MNCAKKDKIVSIIFVVLCVSVALAGKYFRFTQKPLPEDETKTGITAVCSEVVDGNVIIISNNEKVLLIGVAVPQGREEQARAFSAKWLKGKRIRLEFDPYNKATLHKDKEGRLLAYVFIQPPGSNKWKMFNEYIVRSGYARADNEIPFIYEEEFRKCERAADSENE